MFDSTVRSDNLIALYHLWNGKRAERRMPARGDFDPAEMASLLPHLFLVDVGSSPDSGQRCFRYRLIGTAVVNLLGRDSTGKWADEALHGDKTPGIRGLFTLASETKGPVAFKGYIFFIRDRNWVFVEGLILPLSANGEEVDMLLVGLMQVPGSATRTPAPDRGGYEVFAEPRMHAYPDPIIDGLRHSDRLRG